jgi:hypothetical protein
MQPTSLRKLYQMFFGSFALIVASAASLPAQDCGEECGPCGQGKKEGMTWSAQGDYNMQCLTMNGPCLKCGASLVSDVPNVASILQVLGAGPLSSLPTAASKLRDRLLVHPARNLVALRGDGCAAQKIIAVAFLSPDRIAALAKGGAARLDEFIVRQEASRQVSFSR